MIGYVCKYTPVELLTAMDAGPVRMEPQVATFNHAEASMHPNMCSYVKGVFEDFATHDYEGLVLVTCCDSVRRLYDVLCESHPDRFFFLIDLPHADNSQARSLYAHSIMRLAESYREFSGHELRRNCLIEALCARPRTAASAAMSADGKPTAALMGARHDRSLARIAEDAGLAVAADLSCAGMARGFSADVGELAQLDDAALIGAYAQMLLEQLPCARMADADVRERRVAEVLDKVDGVIYHTVKFCDVYSYEYAQLHEDAHVPLLKIETDLTRQSSGQIRTRVEAFAESLGATRTIDAARVRRQRKEGSSMYVLGIDSGSTSTNAAILDADRTLVAYTVVRTGARAADSAQRALNQVLDRAQLEREDIDLVVSTGYGRVSVGFADIDVTEISCHGKGAWYFDPSVRTILDIGGQDSKAIRLDEDGEVAEFVMNDKCAAGTGRFLEAMARTLEVDIEQLGPLTLESRKDVEISSMCTVFAESEVISLIAENVAKEDIARGVHRAIAGKAFSLLKRVGMRPGYMMTGGVAKNPGVVAAVEELLDGEKLAICAEPEIVGAVGAACFGLERLATDGKGA